jgi:hypothetical protein
MNKYIQDSIRNNSRSILKDLTRPQQKSLAEILRGLFTVGEPILRRLAQDETKTAKKQGEKYARHLENVSIKNKVELLALKRVKTDIRKTTIIAYDLTDIAKSSAKKIEKLTKVWDGSARKAVNGFELHGVGINNILTKLEVHDGDCYTRNQVRSKIVTEISQELGFQGIWVFDRGNDDKAFFSFLRHELDVEFIARIRGNRNVVIKKTGVLEKVQNLKPGRYQVFFMNRFNNRVDTSTEFTLIIDEHMEDHEPIRLLCRLKSSYSLKQIVTMYLERWGVENLFKRLKQKFGLEKIRVLNHQKFVNLVALVHLAVLVSTITFVKMHQSTLSLITGVLLLYKKFVHLKNLSQNLDSFISFMQCSLKPLSIRKPPPPPNQQSLFSRRLLEKLGSF